MKIKKITLKNYKFHHNLSFDISKKNCLIYGENGTGKSSIYKALYSNFYLYKDTKIVNNQIDIKEKFGHRDFLTENLEVNVDLTNNLLHRENNSLDNSELLLNQTIYFADEKVFHKIVQNDFYEVINNELGKHFPLLLELDTIYRDVRTGVIRSTINEHEDLVRERKEADKIFQEEVICKIPLDEINNILRTLNENFEIEFEVINSDIKFDIKKFISPKIAIKIKNIEDKGDFKNHFNEAKLKLISIAIYFALAKKYKTEDSDLKLLVLDDFLTSLDMSNRKLIIQYILENFGDYQKIILTHNIQFYNLIVKLLKMREEENNWDIKNIFIRKVENSFESIMYDKETDYIKEAEDYLHENKLNEAGIFLRKEFERVVEELRQKNEVGAKEKLSSIIEQVLKRDSTDINIKKMQKVLKETKFYQESVLHSTAHNDIDRELYTKELNGAIVILKQLNKFLNVLR